MSTSARPELEMPRPVVPGEGIVALFSCGEDRKLGLLKIRWFVSPLRPAASDLKDETRAWLDAVPEAAALWLDQQR